MKENGFYNLYAKSEQYFMRYITGKAAGRRLMLWDLQRNYFQQLQAIATNLFTYEGMGDLLAREIEKRLFLFGRCGIVAHKGTLTAVSAYPDGEDIYDMPTGFTFTFGGGIPDRSDTPDSREIGKNGIYARNTYTSYPTALLVEQYALMLAHADMSIIAELVNGRFMDVLKASSNRDAETARAFTDDLYLGKLSFLSDKAEDMEIDRSGRGISHLGEYLDTKDRLLKDIYSFFGIKKIPEKRERMITGEVEITDKMLSFNLKDMMEQRKKMCADAAAVFGASWGVKCHIDIDADGTLEHEKEMEA